MAQLSHSGDAFPTQGWCS